MPARHSPTVRQRRLRSEIRRLRMSCGLTLDDVEEQSDGAIKVATLSRWETGERTIRRAADLQLLLGVYGVAEDERAALLALHRQSRERGWWQPYAASMPESFQTYIGLETEASVIREYASELVPGLLQTEDYYRAFLTAAPSDRYTAEKLAVRAARQERLSGEDPPQYWAILNEAVIRRAPADPDVMRAQLDRIASAPGDGLTIQVIPFSAGLHQAMEGPFSILSFPDATDPDIAYQENQSGSVYIEAPEGVDRYAQVFGHLMAQALSPGESRRLIASMAAGNA
jgi:transcriptional regulator with XRE-family HTH domain